MSDIPAPTDWLTTAATRWPAPADSLAAGHLRADLPGRPDALLDAIGGNSAYLSDLARLETATLDRWIAEGPDRCLADILAELAAIDPASEHTRVARGLRLAKRRAALVIGLADIAGIWGLEQVTWGLSALADTALRLAVDHLLRAAHDQGSLQLADPARPSLGSGFCVFALGKLGAGELNYSSDIDLVLLYDPTPHLYTDALGERDSARADARAMALGPLFVRLARALVGLLQTADENGYVFRTDLRLRPDPSSTPLVVSLAAALSYYESMGQSWERAAWIKARAVAGDLELGRRFLEQIRPFTWRRYLDFAAIADIAAMKARIDAHKGSRLPAGDDPDGLAGYDLKLGQGGIREIEFIAQALEMVWGGREPGLRIAATLPALAALERAGRLPESARDGLTGAYRQLRLIEHRLQMVHDRQTHALPAAERLDRFAVFLGLSDRAALAAWLLPTLRLVHAAFGELLLGAPAAAPALGDEQDGGDPDLIAQLAAHGFHQPERAAATIRHWRDGHPRATRSERARHLLRELLPDLLPALAGQPEPDVALARFDAFLARLPAGVQILSLLRHNPALLERLAAVLGTAPLLAEHFARDPGSIEGLLEAAPIAEDRFAPTRRLRLQLRDADGLEESLALLRRFVRAEEFALSVALLEGRIDVDLAGLARTRLAEAALGALLPIVLAGHVARHDVLPGGAMVLVALGKAGSREMLPGSDLDLMLIYDHPDGVTESVAGASGRSLPASTWFLRAAHALIGAITAPGTEGPLYELDMRLRPSGNKGPVAVSLASFVRYHQQDAWTWERMALTRARVIGGARGLRAKVRAALASALDHSGEPSRILADAAAMRARMIAELPAAGPWDVKLRAGGLIEVEFIAQALQLIAPAAARDPVTRVALDRLGQAGLLGAEEAALLIRADHLWRSVQALVRLTVGGAQAPPAAACALLARQLHLTPLDAGPLRAKLEAMAGDVRAIFVRRIGSV